MVNLAPATYRDPAEVEITVDNESIGALHASVREVTVQMSRAAATTLEILLDGQGEGNVGGYELTLVLPDGAFEVLGASAGDLLPGGNALGPVVEGNTVRFGAYALRGGDSSGEIVLARLKLRATAAEDATITVARALVVTDAGGEYRVTADGTVVSPEPWTPRGRIYLPSVVR